MAAANELLERLNRRLAALHKAHPDQAEAWALQGQLIRTALESARPPETQPFPLPREHLVARLREGIPLLHDQPAFVDVHFAADLFSRLVNVLQARGDPEQREPDGRLEGIVDAATRGKFDPERLFGEAFVHHQDHLAEIAAQAGVDADVLSTLASQSVAPLLRAYAERLAPLLERVDDGTRDGADWTYGYCPICGGWPLLGELRGVELAEWLRCSACGTAWRTQRLFCPYCANDDYRALGSLAVDGDLRFRVSVCERCKGYLKVGNAFDPPPAELLALDDVVSMHLDVAAIQRGYHRPGNTGFTIELAVPDAEWVEELA